MSPPPPSPPSLNAKPAPDRIRWWARTGIPTGLMILTTVCLLIRITVRDAASWSAIFFYMGPWPILLAAWPVLWAWNRKSRFKSRAALVGMAATLTAYLLTPSPPVRHPAAQAVTIKKVIFWNIAHPTGIPEPVHQLIAAHQPDLVVLAEAEKQTVATLNGFLQRHPGWRILSLSGGLLVAVKGSATVEESHPLPYRSHAHRLTIRFPGDPVPWNLIAADLGPWPPTPRISRIDRIRALAGNRPRTLIAGDFNTPYDSTAFDTWRTTFRHGLTHSPKSPGPATWPLGLPLLSIDHVWMSPDLLPLHAAKGTTLPYDHAWQVITVGTR